MHRTVAAALVAALALALASCGSSTKTETVSRAQAVKRLEAACADGQAKASRQMGTARERLQYLDAIRSELQLVRDRLAGIETTGSAKAPFGAYKATLDVRIKAMERILSADDKDRTRVIDREKGAIGPAGERAHNAIVALGASHNCL